MSEERSEPSAFSRGKITQTFGEITFNSNFDSGNLDRVESIECTEPDQVEFQLWTAPDCAGTVHQNGNRSWFYFSVITPSNYCGKTIKMNIVNLNRQAKLYQQGLTPLIRTIPGRNTWDRMRTRPDWQVTEAGMVLSFIYTPPLLRKTTTYFSFCYPFSYADCQRYLFKIDSRLKMKRKEDSTNIYFHRDLLCYSLDGLHVDLITITSTDGMTTVTEPRLPGLFPDLANNTAYQFKDKKIVLITSRVHPGETPSSFVFNGFLEFLLREDDPRAKALRRHFLFKLVPMINPDGVQRGHYRTDSRGINLNRVYLDPDKDIHPSVYSIQQLMLYYHSKLTSIDTSKDSKSSIEDNNTEVALYVDLHAHAAKRGCFMYGNHFQLLEDQVECMLLPKLVSLNSAHFDFNQCVFSERNMYIADKRDENVTKEGSGRVALYKATGLTYCYTLECNYNSGTHVNPLTPDHTGKCTPPNDGSPIPHKLTIQDFEEVGRGLAIAILDLYSINPCSRLPSTEYATLSKVKEFLRQKIQHYRLKSDARKHDRSKQCTSTDRIEPNVSSDVLSAESESIVVKKTEVKYKITLCNSNQSHHALLSSRKQLVSNSSSEPTIIKRSTTVPFSSFKFPPSTTSLVKTMPNSSVRLPLVKLQYHRPPSIGNRLMSSITPSNPVSIADADFSVIGSNRCIASKGFINSSKDMNTKSVIFNKPTSMVATTTGNSARRRRQISNERILVCTSASKLATTNSKPKQKILTTRTNHHSFTGTKGTSRQHNKLMRGTATYPVLNKKILRIDGKKSSKVTPLKT